MSHGLLNFSVTHERSAPKRHKFTHSFFWFKFELESIDNAASFLISRNRRNLYRFDDDDHIRLGAPTARDNFIAFARQHGLETEVVQVSIYTQLRFMGYVFNPVSIIFLKDTEGDESMIVEIRNTFDEIKPYFVSKEHLSADGFIFSVKKFFYISPFIDHDREMHFKVKKNGDRLDITIEEEGLLFVSLRGKEKKLSNIGLIKSTLYCPFVTLKIIFLIHLHALFLWLKGIPYFKKDDQPHLQKGAYRWSK